jgi:hypothetical protein
VTGGGAGPCGSREGFYVTIKRGGRTGYLLGPFASKTAAEARVGKGVQVASEADPFAAFDLFGVTRAVMRPGAELPAGRLNGTAGMRLAPDGYVQPLASAPVRSCPACGTALDGGPVLFWCARCRRGVYAADLGVA